MNEKAEALDILTSARGALVERVCRIVCRHRDAFEQGIADDTSPLSANRELARAAGELVRLNALLTALEPNGGAANGSEQAASVQHQSSDAFAKYIQLVADERLEEASHLLSGLLSMPLDRMVTATWFFRRASKANPKVVDTLWRLLDSVRDASSAQLMDLMVKTFGFQAVESGMAISALREGATISPLHAYGRRGVPAESSA